MHRRSRRAKRYSANASSLPRSPARPLPMCGHASCAYLQRGRPADGSGELTVVLRPWLRQVAGGKTVQHLAKALLVQILKGILPDQHHRRVHAGAKTFDLFPAEIAVLGQMEGIVVDPALANLDDISGAAQPARRGAANLDVRLLADRLQLEHGVEGRDLHRPAVGHVEQARARPY